MNEFFQILKKDHEEVKGIQRQLKKTKEKESSKREDLFQNLREELVFQMKSDSDSFLSPWQVIDKEIDHEQI